jgi:hypothetical protein
MKILFEVLVTSLLLSGVRILHGNWAWMNFRNWRYWAFMVLWGAALTLAEKIGVAYG